MFTYELYVWNLGTRFDSQNDFYELCREEAKECVKESYWEEEEVDYYRQGGTRLIVRAIGPIGKLP